VGTCGVRKSLALLRSVSECPISQGDIWARRSLALPAIEGQRIFGSHSQLVPPEPATGCRFLLLLVILILCRQQIGTRVRLRFQVKCGPDAEMRCGERETSLENVLACVFFLMAKCQLKLKKWFGDGGSLTRDKTGRSYVIPLTKPRKKCDHRHGHEPAMETLECGPPDVQCCPIEA